MVRRPTLAQRAYDDLKALLQDGVYAPGDFLTEGELAKRLRMSKTPVRTALVRLEVDGFVAISPQQGIVVREPSIQEIFDLFDIRMALETFVARRVAGHLKPEQKERLRKNLDGQARAVRDRDNAAATRLDTEFHIMFCEFLGNDEITQVMQRLREKLHRIILGIQTKHPGRMAEGCREHAAIAEDIVEGRGEKAAQRIVQHLAWGRKYLVTPTE